MPTSRQMMIFEREQAAAFKAYEAATQKENDRHNEAMRDIGRRVNERMAKARAKYEAAGGRFKSAKTK